MTPKKSAVFFVATATADSVIFETALKYYPTLSVISYQPNVALNPLVDSILMAKLTFWIRVP
jgi:hypothetical protein